MTDDNKSLIMVYITTSSEEEAGTIGRKLLDERLIACANIFPGVKSIYRWEGKVVNEFETVLILKARKSNLEKIISRVKDIHSYSCPCILSYPSNGGFEGYINWILKEME